MQFLIRRWVRTNKQTNRKEYREILIRTGKLTVGRAIDQHLQIADKRVEPEHAQIKAGGSRLYITALTPKGFFVNRQPRKSATLKQGDIVQIGTGAITVDVLQRGRPVVLGFGYVGDADVTELEHVHVTSLSQTKLSKPFWSWTLGLGVSAFLFLIPLSSVLNASWREPLRESRMMPSDNVWLSGPLHASHQFIGKDCNACHTSPFEMVRNDRCMTCHATTQHHVDVNSSDVDLFQQERCASCHREHNEPGNLVRLDERLCTDCHQTLKQKKPATLLANVSDFGRDHPEFGLALLTPRSNGNETLWNLVRVSRKTGKRIEERSNLEFPHKVHLDPKGIKSPDGDQVLTCQDCHRPDASGRQMVPITMEAQCSRCHSLQFDENDPDTRVPHGDMKQLYKSLKEYYSRRFLESYQEDQRNAQRRSGNRRQPGGTALTIGRDVQARASDWTEMKTMESARTLLENRVCVDCHVVEKDPLRNDIEQWKVTPVRLTRVFMPRARFDHASHTTSDCLACHKNAEKSETGRDVLMPTIAVCQECHGGSQAKQKLASDCLMCHEFHLDKRGLFDKPNNTGALGPPSLISLKGSGRQQSRL